MSECMLAVMDEGFTAESPTEGVETDTEFLAAPILFPPFGPGFGSAERVSEKAIVRYPEVMTPEIGQPTFFIEAIGLLYIEINPTTGDLVETTRTQGPITVERIEIIGEDPPTTRTESFDIENVFGVMNSNEFGALILSTPAGDQNFIVEGVTDLQPQPLPPDPRTVTFDDPNAIRLLPDQGRFQAASSYTEDFVTFRSGVFPTDPRLGGEAFGFYLLAYDDPAAAALPAGIDPTTQPRRLSSLGGSDVIQMTYDPDGDGVPDPFALESIRVVAGVLNLGIMYADGSIAVYNNLTAASTPYFLAEAADITRATLEAIGRPFSVDDIHLG